MNSDFEFILIFSLSNPSRSIRISPDFLGTMNNVYSENSHKNGEELKFSKYHGATFPLHFPNHFIANFTSNGMKVFDPFGGTGTTLIVCEKQNRQCRMIEIDPIYIDVCIQRFCNHTRANIEEIYESAKSRMV